MPGSRTRTWRGWGLGIGALLLGLFLWQRRPAPVEPASELATNLSRRDGRLYSSATNVPFTGWMLEQYPDAVLKSRSWVSDGRLNGVSEGWFTNGVLQVREQFVDGVSTGPVLKWHANGSRRSEGTAREGKLEGVFRRWHDNGVLAEELTLLTGQADGISRAWFPSGSLKAEVTLKAGQVVTQKFWGDGERPPATALASTKGGP